MDDVISRQAVVECIYKALRTPPLKGTFTDTMSLAISMVNELPSAQSEMDCQKCIFRGFAGFKQFQEIQPKMKEQLAATVQNVPKDDLISRKTAINTFMTSTSDGDKAEWCKWVLEQLPSVQPILTCDGCRHVGTYDTDFPCNGCVRREKDYYDPE